MFIIKRVIKLANWLLFGSNTLRVLRVFFLFYFDKSDQVLSMKVSNKHKYITNFVARIINQTKTEFNIVKVIFLFHFVF